MQPPAAPAEEVGCALSGVGALLPVEKEEVGCALFGMGRLFYLLPKHAYPSQPAIDWSKARARV